MSAAGKYIARAPRYTLRPGDEVLMQFAAMETRGYTSKARLRDLSTTGLSFYVPGNIHSHDVPFEKETLKVEFTLPPETQDGKVITPAQQVAWFATVVRVEEKSEWDPELGDRNYTQVALKFERQPSALISAIRRSLAGKNSEAHALEVQRRHKWILFASAVLCLIAIAALCLPIERLTTLLNR